MSGIEIDRQEPEFAAFVGMDWADQKHVWCLQGRDSTKRENGELKHTPEAVEAWVAQLCQRFGNRPIAVALVARISGVHARQVRALASVPRAVDDVRQYAKSAVSLR